MKTFNLVRKRLNSNLKLVLIALSLLIIALLSSCAEQELPFNPQDSDNAEIEVLAEAYFEDTDDIAANAMLGINEDGGRYENIEDERTTCATVTYTGDRTGGTIVIDFGNGCTDARQTTRKGKIIITYEGRRFLPNSKVTTTFENYFVNDIKIEGTRTLTNVTESRVDAPKFRIVLQGGKATWPDGSFITRESDHVREWKRAVSPLNDEIWVTGNASGTNKSERSYTVEITNPLIYKRTCAAERVFIAVQGTKVLRTNSREVITDYGDGTCNRTITITVNGVSREITVRPGGGN